MKKWLLTEKFTIDIRAEAFHYSRRLHTMREKYTKETLGEKKEFISAVLRRIQNGEQQDGLAARKENISSCRPSTYFAKIFRSHV